MEAAVKPRAGERARLVALGFGTSVAMWAVGFVGRMPPAAIPSWFLLLLMLGCLLAGGFRAGRTTAAGWSGGLWVGLVSSLVNLLILGSLLGGDDPNRIVPSAVLWIPGSFLMGALLGGLGGLAGARARGAGGAGERPPADGTATLARVAAVATFFLLIVGGLVTSKDAGLAVVDWPNSYGYSMFLYPLSKMSGGIYFEHAHRLFGSLVGLTTLVLFVHLWSTESRRWLKVLAGAALLMVVLQGILGGLRVTGRFTMSVEAEAMAPSLTLAIVHGVFAHLFFAVMVALAVFTSSAWQDVGAAPPGGSAGTDRKLTRALLLVLFVQIVLGAFLRHRGQGLLVHIAWAVVVLGLAIASGLRAWGLHATRSPVSRLGVGLIAAVMAQLALGFGALPAVLQSPEEKALGLSDPSSYEVFVATAHQAGGALLVALAVMLLLFVHRGAPAADRG